MSKTITIPSDGGSRVYVTINGRNYVFTAGETVTVPDEVAALLADNLAIKPKGTRETAQDEALAGVTAKISGIETDVSELEGDVDALDTRVSALDTPETGEIDLLKARVTALEPETGG